MFMKVIDIIFYLELEDIIVGENFEYELENLDLNFVFIV